MQRDHENKCKNSAEYFASRHIRWLLPLLLLLKLLLPRHLFACRWNGIAFLLSRPPSFRFVIVLRATVRLLLHFIYRIACASARIHIAIVQHRYCVSLCHTISNCNRDSFHFRSRWTRERDRQKVCERKREPGEERTGRG